MGITILGPQFFELDASGGLKSRVGTLFPRHRLAVTLPGIHAFQRATFLEHLNAQRQARQLSPLTVDEQEQECKNSVDLFFEPEHVLIRPDPAHMELAFAADELLQEVTSKRRIRFLFAQNDSVQRAIKERGECWRISPLPRSREGMRKLVLAAKAAVREQPIYYYSRATGTRWLTFQEFAQLDRLDAPTLARQLEEVAQHAASRNRLGNPEVSFFQADPLGFGARDFRVSFPGLSEPELRSAHRELADHFAAAVDPQFREDDPGREEWLNRMFRELVSAPDETLTEEVLRGLSPEFFLQVEWLPGGRFEEGELIFDSIYDEAAAHPEDVTLKALCDLKIKGFIFNLIREFGDLEYVNVGRVAESLSVRPSKTGRRGVYIVELKVRGVALPVVRLIRLQKWGIRERLDAGRTMYEAITETEDYTDYTLDRRLGCRQLGMNVPPRITIRTVSEIYDGPRPEFRGQSLRVTYFLRDYIPGIATDKLPRWKYRKPGYALSLARLLGKAAASNLVVGRAAESATRVLFDDGDEVVLENAEGLPVELIVGDHSGAFAEYLRPLADFAADYARPVTSRAAVLPEPGAFAELYLDAFREGFLHVQGDYRKRRRAFDSLFKHCKYDPAGSFAYRWECVLKRLDQTDADTLLGAIRKQITSPTAVVAS